MNQRFLSKLVFAGLLLGAGAVQAAGPTSVSEAPAAALVDGVVDAKDLLRDAHAPKPTAAAERGATRSTARARAAS